MRFYFLMHHACAIPKFFFLRFFGAFSFLYWLAALEERATQRECERNAKIMQAAQAALDAEIDADPATPDWLKTGYDFTGHHAKKI